MGAGIIVRIEGPSNGRAAVFLTDAQERSVDNQNLTSKKREADHWGSGSSCGNNILEKIENALLEEGEQETTLQKKRRVP